MSYGVAAYAVSIAELRKAMGSRDSALLARATSREPSLEVALTDLVIGPRKSTTSSEQYGYALEVLCAELGEALEVEAWEGIHHDVFQRVDAGAVPISSYFFDGEPDLDLPEWEDFPVIGCVTAAETDELLLNLIFNGKPSPELAPLLREFSSWVTAANKKKSDLVLFYY